MTTDTKAVARWDIGFYGLSDKAEMLEHYKGRYILFTDYERVVGEWQEAFELAMTNLVARNKEVNQLNAQLATSRAEVEGLRKDAERYRWLKDTPWTENREFSHVIQCQMNAIWDKTIDAAMEKRNV